MRTKLSRRTLLRGTVGSLSVGLALPMLEAMLGDKDAIAAPPPPVFGLFFWGGGLPWHDKHGAAQAGHPDDWTPAETGAAYTPSPLLEPLAPFAPSLVTGLTPHTDVPDAPPGQSDGHMRGFMVAMTGDRIRPEGFDHPSHTLTALRPTLDQYVAKHPDFIAQGSTKFSSLVLGVSPARFHDYGHWNAISYNGPDSMNQPIMNPGQLYNLLFSVPTDTALLERRAKLLDAVMNDGKALRSRLGSADRVRLDQHLDNLDAIQNRLELSGVACEAPALPGDSTDIVQKTDIMAELLAKALVCDLTRVFSFMLTSPASTHVFADLGAPNDLHTTCHNGEWQAVRNVTGKQMQAFATLLGKFSATADPRGGTLLDRSLVFGLSEYGEGYQHSTSEMAAVFAGTCNGKIAGGYHAREEAGNYSKAHVTIMRALGIP
ncbi:MAG: DUF1552 domain-containing protein, partial [Polyangiaceae bacterium]|nr:DUF1552 domain-containing protein [Polyangiaceae bacterium]